MFDLASMQPEIAVLPENASVPGSAWQLLTRMDLHEKATRQPGGAVTISRWTRPVGFLFGPHLRLPQGRYRLRLACGAAHPRAPAQPALGVEIIAQNKVQRGWRDFTPAELQAGDATVEFEVTPDVAADHGIDAPFEFRIVHLENADLTIRTMQLEAIDDDHPIPPSKWRLLGRLRPSWLAFGRATPVRLTRTTVTRLLLWRCLPHLRLAGGRYRLDVDCSVRWVRDLARPVLRLNIDTQNGVPVAAHDFLATELAAGPAGFAFDVPPDLAVENGENTYLDFRISHLRNATVQLRAIDLQPISGHGAALAPAPAPALSLPSRRTNLLVFGNCQAGLVAEAFRGNTALAGQFRIKHHYMELQPNLHEQGKRDLEACDILLVQDIREWDAYPLRAYVPDNVPIINFPCLRFASLWPFDAFNGPDDKEARGRDLPNFEFTYFDGLLGRLRKEIPDREARFAAYRSLEIDRLIDHRRIHTFEERRLAKMDASFGGDIGAYILERFRHRRVFHTTAHPDGDVMAMLLRQIATALGVKGRLRRMRTLSELDRLQIPVHPKVAAALGVKWIGERTTHIYHGERITWETYVRRYIDYYG